MSTLCVGLLADGAAWEARALAVVEEAAGVMVLKRWVDVDDLMASVTTGQFDVAVVAAGVAGLDAAAVTHLRRHGCAVLAVLDGGHPELLPQRLSRAGISAVLEVAALDDLPAVLREAGGALREESPAGVREAMAGSATAPGSPGHGPGQGPGQEQSQGLGGARGQVTVVWGPVGAPGRTTVAAGLAGLSAARGRPTILVDADRHAAVAQHLGVLDQVSGVLAAARMRAAGTLSSAVATTCRALTPLLGVLTGVPRPERRDEVPAGALAEIVEEITRFADVVVDLGHDLAAVHPSRTEGEWAVELLTAADEVIVVGAADPVGLTRLAHALVELRDECGDLAPRVVVNRTRATLGWSEREMTEVVARFAPVSAVHFLPEDRAAVDRALVEGVPVTDRPSSLTSALAMLLDAVRPESVVPRVPRRRTPFGMRRTVLAFPGPRIPAARGVVTLRRAGRDHPR